jgi:hypothetical protein
MSRRADKIRAEAAALRAQCEAQGLERVDALAQEAGFLQGIIEGLAVRLDQLEGVGLKPSKGCILGEVYDSDDNPFTVEYEFEPGSPSKTSGPPERCYEGEAPVARIGGVYYADALLDPDVFNPRLIEKWEEQLCERETDAMQYRSEIDADEWRQRRIDDRLEGL